MRQRWLSRRALLLHVALVVWVPGCLIAFWWQVHRAFSGNGLSYLYSVEWPVFAVTGVWAWWQLVHTDPETVGRRAQARLAMGSAGMGSAGMGSAALGGGGPVAAAPVGGSPAGTAPGSAGEPGTDGALRPRRLEEEDPELAAYNDRLARLASEGPKTWRKR